MTQHALSIEDLQSRASDVADLLKTLSHPARLLIGCELMDGERSVSDLHKATGLSQPNVSRDLKRMRESGLVTGRRDSRQVYYALADYRIRAVIQALCAAFGPGHDIPDNDNTGQVEDRHV